MTVVAFAFGAGLLATVNPCGFAMLPAFLSYYVAGDAAQEAEAPPPPLLARLAQGFAVGAAVSAGFAGLFVAAGLLVAAGLRPLLPYVPWVAVVIGVALVALGLAMLAGRQVGLQLAERLRPGTGRGYRRMVMFGAAYALASLSCTLAVLLAVVAQALATANPVRMLTVFVAYGAGAATVLTALSVSAALAKHAMARGMRRLLPMAGRLGGVLLVLSGGYLIVFWVPVLTGALPNRQVTSLSGGYATWLAALFESNQQALVVLGAALVLAGSAVALRHRLRPPAAVAAAEACCPEPDSGEAGGGTEAPDQEPAFTHGGSR